MPDYGLARPRNHRYTYPEGVQVGGVPVVGEGIQIDLDMMVQSEVGLPRLMSDEGHALGRDALLPQLIQSGLALGAFGGQQGKPRARYDSQGLSGK